MQSPYAILGLPSDADEGTVRRRYLELVREHPPEHEPAKAAEFRAAYDALRDPIVRLQDLLFSLHSHESMDSILATYQRDIRDSRLPTKFLLSLGQE